MWTDFDDLYVIRRVYAQGCAFCGSRSYCSPFWGQNPPKTPILGAWIGIFKLNVQNIKICILSKFLHRLLPNLYSHTDHQVLFVGGPNTRKSNPRGRTAAILKNRKSAISPERFDRSSRNLARWRIMGLQMGLEVKISNFWKSKMAEGRHFEKWKSAIKLSNYAKACSCQKCHTSNGQK